MFDRLAHMRRLSTDPVLRAKRNEAVRQRNCITWTPEMDAKLIELATARVGAVPIGNAIGVGKAAVRKRRHQLGLPKGKPPGPSRKVPQAPGTVIVKLISN